MNNFEEACLQSCESWVDEFDFYVEYEFSKEFEKKMRTLFDKMRNDKYHHYTRKTIRFLVVAAIIFSFTATVLAIPTTREYIITKYKDHFSYIVNDVSDIVKVKDFSINYIPKDFIKTDELISTAGITYEYQNDSYWFTVSKTVIDANVNYDISSQKTKTINGIDYTIYVTDHNCGGVIWNNGIYIYSVEGNIDENELMKIALKTE